MRDLLHQNDLPDDGVDDHLQHFVIATENERRVGAGGMEVYGQYGLLRSVAIDEAHQGKELGTALCHRLMEDAETWGVTEVYLLTTTAARFFEKLGFSLEQRENAPKVIQETEEFTSLCPSSTACMRMMC